MTGEQDTAQKLTELAQEIIQQVQMLLLRVRNLTEDPDSGEYAEYMGSFDRIQKLFDQFSVDFRDAGFPNNPEVRDTRRKLSGCFQEFFQVRTGFFKRYAARAAELDQEPILEATPEETEENAMERDPEEDIGADTETEPEEEPEAPEDGKKKKKRTVKKSLSASEQTRQDSLRAEAARMGMPVQPDQPITEAELRNAQYRLDEERQRQETAAAENIRRENESLTAYRERMAQSAAFQHLESSHIDLSREGIGRSPADQSDTSEDVQKAALTAASAVATVAAVQKEVERREHRQRQADEQTDLHRGDSYRAWKETLEPKNAPDGTAEPARRSALRTSSGPASLKESRERDPPGDNRRQDGARVPHRPDSYQEWTAQRRQESGRLEAPDTSQRLQPGQEKPYQHRAGALQTQAFRRNIPPLVPAPQTGTGTASPKRYLLSKITTNLGAVSYVAFSVAAQKAAQEASRENDTASGLLNASYYVPAVAGLAWSAAHKPAKPLERSARRISPDELAKKCKDTIRGYERLKSRQPNLEKQLAALSGTDKLSAQRRGQLQEQLAALKGQLPAAERAAAQSRRIQHFQHQRNLDRELVNRLTVKGKMPKGAKALNERSQGILQKDNRTLVKKYGSLSGLSEKEIRNRVQRLTMEGKAQKLRIRQLESKGAALSSAERQLLKKLKGKSAVTGKEIASLVGLARARSNLAYKESRLHAIVKAANKRYMYRLNGIRLVRSFALRPLYVGQDSNTEGLAYMSQIAMDPNARRIVKGAVKLPFRASGKVIRRAAPKFAYNVQVKTQAVKAKLHHIVSAPKRTAAWAVKKAGTTISSAIPIQVKTRVTAPVRYVRGKYSAARTAYTGAKKWLAGTRVGRTLTSAQILGKRITAVGHLTLGILKKGLLIGLGIYLGLVLMISITGSILPTTASSSSLILSTEPSVTGKINLSPYCEILRMEKLRFDDRISQIVMRYEEDDAYDSVELSLSGAENLRETLSMMAVRLQQSLDTTSNPEVENYLRFLYRSSHPYSVSEHQYECAGCKTRIVQVVKIDPETGEPSLQMELESYCPGHIDVFIQITVLSFDDIFGADTYTIPNDEWEGWTEDNIAWCRAIYDMDWAELYEGVSLSTAPLFGDLEISENVRRVWDYLMALTGNPYGAAGLMGNLSVESGLRPNNLEDSYEPILGYDDDTYTQAVDNGTYQGFVNDGAGYGLAQWTDSARKEALLAFAQAQGKSIGDLSMQLQFLSKELSGSDVLDVLRSASSVREASDIVLTDFENPADQSEAVKAYRARMGEYFYNTFVLGIQAEGTLTQKQMKVIQVATNSEIYHIQAASGYCQRWAAQVYAAAGLPLDSSCCAYHSGVNHGVSDDWSVIPPGAAVYGYSGTKYGHVGIYVGNGLVYHNRGGVAVDTLSNWIQIYDGFCWGWEAGTDLTLPD